MAAHPFVVRTSALKATPGSVLREHREGSLPGLVVGDSRIDVLEPIVVDAALAWASDTIVVTADVATRWVGTCRRCLADASGSLVAEHVREVYEAGSDGEETYDMRGDEVDLSPLVRDAVLLGLPPAPLCSEGCKGLCPACGANRNADDCSCDTEPIDPRWAALDALRVDAAVDQPSST